MENERLATLIGVAEIHAEALREYFMTCARRGQKEALPFSTEQTSVDLGDATSVNVHLSTIQGIDDLARIDASWASLTITDVNPELLEELQTCLISAYGFGLWQFILATNTLTVNYKFATPKHLEDVYNEVNSQNIQRRRS